MKILIQSLEYPPLGGGGAKVVSGLSKELVKIGHEVDVVTMGYRGLPRYEVVNGVHVYRIGSFRLRKYICSTLEMIPYIIAAIPFQLRLYRKKRYDINHTHFIFPDGIISYVIKKLKGFPYIVTAHGSDVPGYNPNRFKRIHKLFFPFWRVVVDNADYITAPSEVLKMLIHKNYPDKEVTVIPNGIDVERFQPARNKENSILVVTRMFERKGIQYFLKALEGLSHVYTINIVGDGPYLTTLQKLAHNLNLPVTFWGYLDHSSNELQRLFEKSRIFVFPSAVEDFPIVLLEAMTAEMTIITTEGTGCAEVVGDTAILVKPKDPDGIKKALQKLMKNPSFCQKLGQSARKRVEENFSWASIAKRYRDIYEN